MKSATVNTLADQHEFERGCAGKERYHSEEAARMAINTYRDLGMIHNASNLTPYPCRLSEDGTAHYHFGH